MSGPSRVPMSLRMAFGALAISALVTVWTLAQVLRTSEPPAPSATELASLDKIARPAPAPRVDVGTAIENDLFSPDRSAPAASYRMPGENDSGAQPAVMPERPTLLGTAVANDGRDFATVQLNDGQAKLVRVGDKIGEWTVKAITRGKVVLASGPSRVEITNTAAAPPSGSSSFRSPDQSLQSDMTSQTVPDCTGLSRAAARGRRIRC